MSSISFKFLKGAEINSMRARKVTVNSDTEDKILTLSFTLSGEVEGSVLCDVFGSQPNEIKPFWRDNKDNDATFFGITSISSSLEVTGHKVKVSNKNFANASIKKFIVTPVAGMKVFLSCDVVLHGVEDGDVEKIAGLLGNSVTASITGPAKLI